MSGVKSIGDRPAFARSGDGGGGMTYRQWLIGQVLGGSVMLRDPIASTASNAIWIADETIRNLDAHAVRYAEKSHET